MSQRPRAALERGGAPDDARGALSRKGFLRASALAIGGLALAGCDLGGDHAAPEQTLDGFIELSRVVSGVDELPEEIAPDYLAALEGAALPMSPSTLVRIAGYADGHGPATFHELEASSAFTRRGARACADAVTAAWWSGLTPTKDGGTQVVSYLDALVWRALPYAQPPSNCLGATGAWAEPGSAQ
jgi:Membrane bound FAD containing D-sorbitol dehydrogenase